MIVTEYVRRQVEPKIKLNTETLKYAYQPIFDVRTGAIFGYEALMRPEGYTPMEIIEAYTEADCLEEIEEATFYYGTKGFMEANLEGYLFINTFTDVCMTLEGARRVASLGGEQMRSRFVVEILEYAQTDPSVWRIKKRAMELSGADPLYAIDDFGTGVNIDHACIEMYRPNIVKIDRKFIRNIDTNYEHQLIVADMLKNLHREGITVLAEGVETKQEYDYLMQTDIDLMQGYYLGMPQIYNSL